jgi:hypothetical protein
MYREPHPVFCSLKLSGYNIYHQISHTNTYIIPTECIYVFHIITATKGDISLHRINGLIFVIGSDDVNCAIQTEPLNMKFNST